MECRTILPVLTDTSTLLFIRDNNAIVSVLSIAGNSLLIWGLNKTGQTITISFQFIILMSSSDLITGMSSLVLLTLVPWKYYSKNCWLALLTQFLLGLYNLFSFSMLNLIALDRYLHIKYMARYPLVFTKKRGYILAILSLFCAAAYNAFLLLPLHLRISSILQSGFTVVLYLFIFAIIILYNHAMRELRRKANQISRRVGTQSRVLLKAAKRIVLCTILLTLPLAVIFILGFLKKYRGFLDISIQYVYRWFAYITFLVNAFCSSCIFMLQNRPIRQLLKRFAIRQYSRMRSTVGVMITNE